MSVAHTPGPWADNLHHEKRDGGRFLTHVTAGGALVPIACVPTGVEGYGREEGRANAHLIAAAPDLLKALEHILAGALSLPRFAEDEARAAIAKSRGQS